MDNKQITVIYDMLFQVRDSMDMQIRYIRDVRNVLSVLECGFEHIEENGQCEASTVRIMSRYLKELETSLMDHSKQIRLIEDVVGVNHTEVI
ncbi:MAG: hypothetical protein LUH04_03950 [Clostridium sp.]|nr:hypothetical protein [Enterocloster asparagiformis]MCD7906842.1 hypothetical protein [Clostridium sp.]